MKYTIKYTKEDDRVYAKAWDSNGVFAELAVGDTKEEALQGVIEKLQPVNDLGSEEIEVPEETVSAPDEKQTEIENANKNLI